MIFSVEAFESIFLIVSSEQGDVTALRLAAVKGHHRCVSILVAGGANVNVISEVIHWRSTIGHPFCNYEVSYVSLPLW